MKATFIDCYVKNDEIVLWLKQDKKNIRLIDRFIPKIFVKGRNLNVLMKRFLDNGVPCSITKKRSFFGGHEVSVLAIPIHQLCRYHELINYLERLQDYAIELYNADLKLEEAYIFEKDLFPTAEVEYEEENGQLKWIKTIESNKDIKYKVPDFAVARIDIKTEESLFKTMDTKLIEIKYNEKNYSGSIIDILASMKRDFEEQDPDIIWSENGNLILPYLKKQFDKYGIEFNFNRFEKDDFDYKEGESYWAYTNIIYRTASIFLKGRLHFDSKSFYSDETGFYGIIEGARICRQRIQRIEMRSAGAAVTNLLLYESYKRGFLLPYKVGIYERFKTLGQLYEADRGSIIFEPRVGFHTDVVELDFVSLYPQIMWKYNLSPETLFCACCPDNKVPGLHYNFCKRERGIVSIVAEQLIKRRVALKKEGTPIAKEKAAYIKWLLVTMFGYQAFKNRKIGIIEAHESIQAYAREIIMKTVRVAESLGWEVIHGIVDSVYVKKKGHNKNQIDHLKHEIIKQTGFEIAVEGSYKWIVFLPSISNEMMPVSNHFYGIFDNGEIKARGIEVRRKDMPQVVIKMQSEMIKILSNAASEKEFVSLFGEIFRVLRKYIDLLDETCAEDLMVSRRISKTEYTNNIPQKIIIEELEEDGWEMHPGQTIDYIIRDVDNIDPYKRYVPIDSFDGCFDKEKYADLMVKATFNILQPFGISEKMVWEKTMKTKQMKLV